jgi:hypothetical protein
MEIYLSLPIVATPVACNFKNLNIFLWFLVITTQYRFLLGQLEGWFSRLWRIDGGEAY